MDTPLPEPASCTWTHTHSPHTLPPSARPPPPRCYVLRARRVTENFAAYKQALAGLDSLPCYAVKANNNLLIMKTLAAQGAGAVLVSGNELKLAMEAGFNPERCG